MNKRLLIACGILSFIIAFGLTEVARPQERPVDVQMIEGAASSCTSKASSSGTSVVVSCPGFTRIIRANLPVRYLYDVYRWDGTKYVPQFSLPGGTTTDPSAYNRGWNDARAAVVVPPAK